MELADLYYEITENNLELHTKKKKIANDIQNEKDSQQETKLDGET